MPTSIHSKLHNLPLEPELVTRPLRWESGAEAVNILLDERRLRPGVDFQAVVAVSDMLALVGFENSARARFSGAQGCGGDRLQQLHRGTPGHPATYHRGFAFL